jgi:thioredoxin
MKKIFYVINLFLMCSLSISLNAQTATNLEASAFAAKLKQTPHAQLIDVRTPGEFAQGHINQAQNIDLRASDFEQKAAKLDKSKPVYVYCLSGGRSSSAANTLSSMGFREVYNLSGGMMRWRATNMPETTASTVASASKPSMTMAQYKALLNTKKLVLIDFYADWCSPCQKMKPYLEEISKEMKDKVVVIRIDADANKALAKQLKVDALPVLFLYKGEKMVWSNKGYISKEEVVKKLKVY